MDQAFQDHRLTAACQPAEQGPERAIEIIREPETWRHPALAGYVSLQSELLDLAGQIPALLELLAALPQSLPHGDASPQNLLERRPASPARPARVLGAVRGMRDD